MERMHLEELLNRTEIDKLIAVAIEEMKRTGHDYSLANAIQLLERFREDAKDA